MDWFHVKNIIVNNTIASNLPDASYILKLLDCVTPDCKCAFSNIPHSILAIIHSTHRHQETKFYRHITCHDRLVSTTIVAHLAITDIGSYILWDKLVDQREFLTLIDLINFLILIEDQIRFTCPTTFFDQCLDIKM